MALKNNGRRHPLANDVYSRRIWTFSIYHSAFFEDFLIARLFTSINRVWYDPSARSFKYINHTRQWNVKMKRDIDSALFTHVHLNLARSANLQAPS